MWRIICSAICFARCVVCTYLLRLLRIWSRSVQTVPLGYRADVGSFSLERTEREGSTGEVRLRDELGCMRYSFIQSAVV